MKDSWIKYEEQKPPTGVDVLWITNTDDAHVAYLTERKIRDGVIIPWIDWGDGLGIYPDERLGLMWQPIVPPDRSSKDNLGPGTSVSEPIPGVMLACISPEAEGLLDRTMEAWKTHKAKLPETITVGSETWNPRESVYGFAYWLIRWSGLVKPADRSKS